MNIESIKSNTGKLWWFADNKMEADNLADDLSCKGATIQLVKQNDVASPIHSVIFSLEKDKAEDILGYIPEESEWMQ